MENKKEIIKIVIGDEMEIGDYVRTKYGISKIVPDGNVVLNNNGNKTIYVDRNGIPKKNELAYYVWSKDIINTSKNIIDLIEENDYINGLRVEKNKYGDLYIGYVYCGGEIGRTQESYATFIKDMETEDIESIVTKEQFKNMEYRIDDINE